MLLMEVSKFDQNEDLSWKTPALASGKVELHGLALHPLDRVEQRTGELALHTAWLQTLAAASRAKKRILPTRTLHSARLQETQARLQ